MHSSPGPPNPPRKFARLGPRDLLYNSSVPRFALLQHEMPSGSAKPSHVDLLLEDDLAEDDHCLLTWSIPVWPVAEQPVAAERLPAHRRSYLDYEGPVSQGRGRVTRSDGGEYQTLVRDDHQLIVRLMGSHVAGVVRLSEDDAGDWWLSLETLR